MAEEKARDPTKPEIKPVSIPLSKIHDLPGSVFAPPSQKSLEALTSSIVLKGVQEPVILRQREDGEFQIVSGNRRRKASELAKKTEIPAFIYDMTEKEARDFRLRGNANVALVMVQDQSATVFGTKDRWKSLMRSVNPAEEKNGVKIYTRSSFGKGYVLTDVYDVRQTSWRDLKRTALQPDSKEMTEALKTLLNYCVVPLVSDESIPMPALYDPNQMKMAVNPKYNDAEAFAGIATEIAHVRFHAKGYNQNYSRDDYELDAQSVGYMICRRFGVPCEAPDVSNLAAFYDGFDPQDRRQALGQIQDMAQKIGGSIERAITPQVRSRNMNRSAR